MAVKEKVSANCETSIFFNVLSPRQLSGPNKKKFFSLGFLNKFFLLSSGKSTENCQRHIWIKLWVHFICVCLRIQRYYAYNKQPQIWSVFHSHFRVDEWIIRFRSLIYPLVGLLSVAFVAHYIKTLNRLAHWKQTKVISGMMCQIPTLTTLSLLAELRLQLCCWLFSPITTTKQSQRFLLRLQLSLLLRRWSMWEHPARRDEKLGLVEILMII